VQGRPEAAVDSQELSMFPQSLGKLEVNRTDSTVSASVLGLARKKALYRKGFGCTLLNDVSEKELIAKPRPVQATGIASEAGLPWPKGAGEPEADSSGIDTSMLRSAIDVAFTGSKKNATNALLIIHKGKLISEKYAAGFNQHSLFYGWSMAKSVASALIGVLQGSGKLSVDQPAPVPDWSKSDDPRHAIRLEHLLQQTSGLDFLEYYAGFSDVTNMLFNQRDMAAYTASRPLQHPPGTVFNYSSGNSNLLSGIIRRTVGEQEYINFPNSALFQKIGMNSAILEPDPSGNFIMSSCIFATARDYARFGLLYLHDGVWEGGRILPEGWVQKTRTAPPGNKLANYGYQFWLNGRDKNDPSKLIFPEAPRDMFYADGFGGQYIFIIPSRDLVVVRLGWSSMEEHEFFRRLFRAIP
jgi:CubicO group peptidase (beta-lactamase class C family)